MTYLSVHQFMDFLVVFAIMKNAAMDIYVQSRYILSFILNVSEEWIAKSYGNTV